MNDKILALLVATFAGVRKDGLKQLARVLSLQATTDDEAKALVEKLTKEQVDEFIKDYRADVDKEVTESGKTIEANLKKKHNITDDPKPDNKKDEKNDPSDIAKIVADAVKVAVEPLQSRLDQYEGKSRSESRLQALSKELVSCKDEAFKAKALKDFKRMNFETDDEFDEYLTETKTDIEAANQGFSNSTLGGFGKPTLNNKPSTAKEASKEELDEVVGRMII